MAQQRTKYTPAFRQQALEKVYSRGRQSVVSVAEQLNMNPWTLKNWMSADKKQQHNTYILGQPYFYNKNMKSTF